MRRTSFLAILWTIREERNLRLFEDILSSDKTLADRLKFTIASWVSTVHQFQDFPLDLIVSNWKEVVLPFMGACT